jgi:hypothetical protein
VRNLDFNGDQIAGPVPEHVKAARQLVRGVRVGHEVEQHIYQVVVRTDRRGTRRLTGRLVSIVRPSSGPVPVPGLRHPDIAILDNAGVLIEPVIPEDPITWVESPTRILTNASETVALVIPVGATTTLHSPLPSGTYQLEFALERVRYRAQTPDAESNYRATAALTVALA